MAITSITIAKRQFKGMKLLQALMADKGANFINKEHLRINKSLASKQKQAKDMDSLQKMKYKYELNLTHNLKKIT